MIVLTAIDLSEASSQVLRVAAHMAGQTGAELYVLHAAEPDPDFVGYDVGPQVVRDDIAREFRDEHRAVQKLAGDLRDEGIKATALLVQGPAVSTTLSQAEKLGAELIVVGSHGHGALYSALVGSCSAGILRKSKVPVLVVPTRKGSAQNTNPDAA